MSIVNYRLIFNELLNSVQSPEDLKQHRWMHEPQYVNEFRTIGFTTTRQTGKTNFLSGLVDEGRAILLTIMDGCVTNCCNRIRAEYHDRVMTYNSLTDMDMLDKFKDKNIRYICLDESAFVKIDPAIYKKLLEVFGENMVVVRT